MNFSAGLGPEAIFILSFKFLLNDLLSLEWRSLCGEDEIQRVDLSLLFYVFEQMGAHDRFAGAGQPLKFKINENVDTPLDRPFFSWRGGSRPGMSI